MMFVYIILPAVIAVGLIILFITIPIVKKRKKESGTTKKKGKATNLDYDKCLKEAKELNSHYIFFEDKIFKKLYFESIHFAPTSERTLNYYGDVEISIDGQDIKGIGYCFAVLDKADNSYTFYCCLKGPKKIVHNSIKLTNDADVDIWPSVKKVVVFGEGTHCILESLPYPNDKEYLKNLKKYIKWYIDHHEEAKKEYLKEQKELLKERKERQAEKRKIGYDQAYANCSEDWQFEEFWEDYLNDEVFWGDDLRSAFGGTAVVDNIIFIEELRWGGFGDTNIFVRMIKYFISKRASKNEKINEDAWYTIDELPRKNAMVNFEYNEVKHLKLLKKFEAKLHEDYKILMLPERQFTNTLLEILGED